MKSKSLIFTIITLDTKQRSYLEYVNDELDRYLETYYVKGKLPFDQKYSLRFGMQTDELIKINIRLQSILENNEYNTNDNKMLNNDVLKIFKDTRRAKELALAEFDLKY